MINVQGFRKELEFEVDKKLTFEAKERVRAGTQAAYNFIMTSWPKLTYFSGANNRISITGRPINRIEPSKRPSEPGALIGKFESIFRSNLEKLNRIPDPGRRNFSVIIGNAVDYAPDVGFQPGQGIAIYQTAYAVASVVMRGGS